MDIKLIVCDLDGTLLTGDKRITRYTRDILHKCRAHGIKFAIATARSRYYSQAFAKITAADALIYNGGSVAMVSRKPMVGSSPVYFRFMDGDKAADLCRQILTKATYVAAESDEFYFYSGIEPTAYANEIAALGHYVCKTDFSDPLPGVVHKISAVMNPADASAIAANFADVDCIAYHGENLVRFAHAKAAKWPAVAAVARHFGIDHAQIAAFGDDYNDIEMLAAAGHGVAMANAISPAKAAARHICGTNDADGVATWLATNILEG